MLSTKWTVCQTSISIECFVCHVLLSTAWIAPGSFYVDHGVLWGTLEMLDGLLDLYFPFEDSSQLRRMSEGFSKFSHGRLKHCVLAVDGWVCHTRKPYASEVDFPLAYRNRKNCYGLVVLAGCDATS